MRMLTGGMSAYRRYVTRYYQYITRYYQYVTPIFKNFRTQHGQRGVMRPHDPPKFAHANNAGSEGSYGAVNSLLRDISRDLIS